ncbi:MAG: sulfatase-like hydrolase/transferase [Planctomycetota bacterium]|jgi:arylsulfatase A-like enzyme|nr:sulfatase-like hydrolase/transferase [Planctomycetota bacterium]
MNRILLFALTLLIGHGVMAGESAPNFLLILVDDMGWTGSSHQVDPDVPESKSDFYQTPHIARLATEGVSFSNAYAPAPMCTPSRAAILTGKSPARLHMTCPGTARKAQAWQKVAPPMHVSELPEDETTLAEVLKAEGYVTAHLGKWHLHGGGPGKHGFDVHDGDTGNEAPESEENPKDIFGIATRAKAFLKEQKSSGKPFYLQLSHYAVHSPVAARPATLEAVAKRTAGARHNRQDYAAMTQDFDTSVGQVLEALKTLGLAKNTYVIFTSDNGAGARGASKENVPLAGGKASLWEGGVRVPMMITGPGVPKGVNRSESVIGTDLFRTISQLAGVKQELPEGLEGASLVPLLLPEPGAFKRARPFLAFHFPHYGKGPKQKPYSAMRKGNHKLLWNHETGAVQLFDLKADLGEKKDLAEAMPEKATALKKELDAYFKEIEAQMPKANPDYDPEAQATSRKQGFAGRFDKDGDGKISREEFSGPARRFDRLDKNRDGVLSGDEIPSGPPQRR